MAAGAAATDFSQWSIDAMNQDLASLYGDLSGDDQHDAREKSAVRVSAMQPLADGPRQIPLHRVRRPYTRWRGIPVLILPERGLFSATETSRPGPTWRDLVETVDTADGPQPDIARHVSQAGHNRTPARAPASVLIVGAGAGGIGAELDAAAPEIIRLDATAHPELDVIADGHDLPFRRHIYAVVIQAVPACCRSAPGC
jgi:hypothetical protein